MGEHVATTSHDLCAKTIYFRPEAWDAEYYSRGNHAHLFTTLSELSRYHPICILPRSKRQIAEFESIASESLTVAKKPLTLIKILKTARAFIGDFFISFRSTRLAQRQ